MARCIPLELSQAQTEKNEHSLKSFKIQRNGCYWRICSICMIFFLALLQSRRTGRPNCRRKGYHQAQNIILKHWVILKKVSFGIQNCLGFQGRKKFYQRMQRPSAISEQVFMLFGHCQNHQVQTFKRPYWPKNHDWKIILMQK